MIVDVVGDQARYLKIDVGDKVRYLGIEGRTHDPGNGVPVGGIQMNVTAWVTRIWHSTALGIHPDSIDIAWRGDGHHPDARPDLELHTREQVTRIGAVPAEIHPVLAGRPPEFCNHDGTRAHVQWEKL